MSLEVSSKITVDWRIEGINELLKKAETEDVWSDSSSFLDGHWMLSAEDDAGANKGEWKRYGQWSYTFEFVALDGTALAGSQSFTDVDFSAARSSWGRASSIKRAELAVPSVSKPNAFTFRCHLERSPPMQQNTFATTAPSLFGKTLDHPTYSDVVLRLQSPEASGACILDNKLVLTQRCSYFRSLFTSGFSESSTVLLDPSALPGEPNDPLAGDISDFEAFEASLTSQACADTGVESSCGIASSAPSPLHGSSSASALARPFLQVPVSDCSYSTLDSLLFFLRTGKVCFLPSTGNYLIAFQDEGSSHPYSISGRNAWLNKAVEGLGGPGFCNPHALYRLADRYLLGELKKLAKERIVRGLTVQNVGYEAFSCLSRDFEDVQKDAVEFVLKNWKEVKATRAWSQAMELLSEGHLPGGLDILRRVHEGLETKS
ncbi:hypothetical protein JCM10213_007977 [Rhodosporidiobolus nylandii]